MILIIAQNPKTELNKVMPLFGTKSYETLAAWLEKAGHSIDECDIVNACSKMGKITKKDIDLRHHGLGVMSLYDKIIVLGNIAAYYAEINLWNRSYFKLPHPSGLNRKLNDKKYIHHLLSNLKDYLDAENSINPALFRTRI